MTNVVFCYFCIFLQCFSNFVPSTVTCGLSPPTIVSNEEEFVLQPNSVFNISCTGKRNVVWAEPLPANTFVYPGYYTATLFIYNATVENTGYYMCVYETQEAELEGGEEEYNEAGIYVFVPGEYIYVSFFFVFSWSPWELKVGLFRDRTAVGVMIMG